MGSKKVTGVFPKRGEVYLISFDPSRGSEIRKTRPAVIIQNDIANLHSSVTIVAAITSTTEQHIYPTDVALSRGEAGLDTNSLVLLNQIRTMDRSRLLRRLGTVSSRSLRAIDRALEISLGLTEM